MISLGKEAKNKDFLNILKENQSHYVLDLYLYVKNRLSNESLLQPGSLKDKDGRLGVVPVVLHYSNMYEISSI